MAPRVVDRAEIRGLVRPTHRDVPIDRDEQRQVDGGALCDERERPHVGAYVREDTHEILEPAREGVDGGEDAQDEHRHQEQRVRHLEGHQQEGCGRLGLVAHQAQHRERVSCRRQEKRVCVREVCVHICCLELYARFSGALGKTCFPRPKRKCACV